MSIILFIFSLLFFQESVLATSTDTQKEDEQQRHLRESFFPLEGRRCASKRHCPAIGTRADYAKAVEKMNTLKESVLHKASCFQAVLTNGNFDEASFDEKYTRIYKCYFASKELVKLYYRAFWACKAICKPQIHNQGDVLPFTEMEKTLRASYKEEALHSYKNADAYLELLGKLSKNYGQDELLMLYPIFERLNLAVTYADFFAKEMAEEATHQKISELTQVIEPHKEILKNKAQHFPITSLEKLTNMGLPDFLLIYTNLDGTLDRAKRLIQNVALNQSQTNDPSPKDVVPEPNLMQEDVL